MGLAAAFPERHWYRRSALSAALWPLSLAFGAGVAARRALYRAGVLAADRLPVPVVVVGNRVVGGAGKTPLALWIAQALARRGRRPGIVSRGYGGAEAGPAEVPPGGDWRRYGDEPILLAEARVAPVWIGRRRAAAARAMLAAHPDCDVVLSDDGLQHYALARDVEIAVVDARGDGNGFLLPAGPLREPASRRVDAIVGHGAPGDYAMCLEPAGFVRVADVAAVAVETLRGRRLHAARVSGPPRLRARGTRLPRLRRGADDREGRGKMSRTGTRRSRRTARRGARGRSARRLHHRKNHLGKRVDSKLLDILVCPVCKGPLKYDRAHDELVSVESGLAYPIRDGIPVMLEDEARKLAPDEVDAWRRKR
jgi:tetraacyldisaccharide 4'-kinase